MINFIHIWKKQIPDDICDQVIEIFEDITEKNPAIIMDGRRSSKSSNIMREDYSISLDKLDVYDDIYPNRKQICDLIYEKLWKCYSEYTYAYGQLAVPDSDVAHTCSELKVQKTMPHGGFHVWHYEQAGSTRNMSRELVWTVYLNTMPPNEAETEFLYQAVKIQPQKGTICLFPAAMTHVHRGLTVYTQPKYIITGWFSRVIREDQKVDKRQLTFNF